MVRSHVRSRVMRLMIDCGRSYARRQAKLSLYRRNPMKPVRLIALLVFTVTAVLQIVPAVASDESLKRCLSRDLFKSVRYSDVINACTAWLNYSSQDMSKPDRAERRLRARALSKRALAYSFADNHHDALADLNAALKIFPKWHDSKFSFEYYRRPLK